MSKYTVTLRQIIQSGFDIGLKDYPIYNEEHRETLNNMIINHYLMSEIGQETPELFRIYLNNTMNEIMPRYNLMYKALDEYYEQQSLLGNIDLTTTETISGTNNQTNSGTDTVKNYINQSGKNIRMDTPQGELTLQDIDAQTVYATEATISKAIADGDDNKTITEHGAIIDSTNSQTRTNHVHGNNGGKYSLDIINQMNDSIYNVDAQIIKELQPLFFGLY